VDAADAVERFAALVALPEPEIPLAEAAALVGARANPDLDVAKVLGELDAIARRCPDASFLGVVEHLHGTEGFRGDTERYSSPANSFLDAVIARRAGIPITLSVVTIEVARRVGVDADGVGMPGHFLVRDGADEDRYWDAFHGRVLDAEGCKRVFEQLFGSRLEWSAQYLAPTGSRAILSRILANLEAGPNARDIVAAQFVLRLHRSIPGLRAQERAALAGRCAALGDFVGASEEYTLAATLVDEPAASELLAQAREQRARSN
jgi:regulator of sirC expression with transglutaminase-like and TPR domain